MEIDEKKKAAVENLFRAIKEHFPEVKLIDYHPSPENPGTIWLNITAPESEEREMLLMDYAADEAMSTLINSNCHVLVMPERNGLKMKAHSE